MILRDFIALMSICHAPIEVRSAYNDKLLCRNVIRGNHEDIMGREVVAFRPEIKVIHGLAHPSAFVYVNGAVELYEEMARKKEDEHGSD